MQFSLTLLRWLVTGLSPRRTRFERRYVHVRFVVCKMSLGQVFSPSVSASPCRYNPRVLHTHLHIDTIPIRRTRERMQKAMLFRNWGLGRQIGKYFHLVFQGLKTSVEALPRRDSSPVRPQSDYTWTNVNASSWRLDKAARFTLCGWPWQHAFLCNKSYARFFARRHYVRLNKAGMWFSSSTSQHPVNKSLKEGMTLKLWN